MAITREESLAKLEEWTTRPSLINHSLALEVVMREVARRLGLDDSEVDRWALTGLLHDADYERWPADHPSRVVEWLRSRGEEEMAHAIGAHYTKWGVPAVSPMDQVLLASDELTGFVMACCLIRPEGISSLKAKSVWKRLKDRSFAAKVDREEIRLGLELLGGDPLVHVQVIIDILKEHSSQLGINGTCVGPSPPSRGS